MLILGANILVTVMATLFVLTCLFMMLVILIQKPKGGGLSGAFGGAGGSSQAAFGAKTGDLLTTITIGCFVAFLGLAIGLTYAIRADVAPRTASPPANTTTTSNPAGVPTDAADTETDAPTGSAPVDEAADKPGTQDAPQPSGQAQPAGDAGDAAAGSIPANAPDPAVPSQPDAQP
jgi:preprotein translocase subunit SecG